MGDELFKRCPVESDALKFAPVFIHFAVFYSMNDKVAVSFDLPVVKKKKRLSLRFLLPVIIIAILAAGAYWLWGRSANPAQSLSVQVVEKGTVEDNVTALGNLQPRNYVDVGAQVSGQLKKLYVNIGDQVKEGDLLAEIDATVQLARVEASRAQLLGLQAQLAERQAQLELARHQFERQQRLKKQNATSEEAFQSAQANVKVTQAQIDMLKAQIQQTESSLKGEEATLGYARIYSPMNGTVVSLEAREGQTLNANQQAPIILRVADLSTMTVWTQVSEADVPKLKVGMEAYFSTLGSPNRFWRGTLNQILPTPEVLNNVVLYTALFDVANPHQELMTQMSAQVFFVIAKAEDVVTVPMSALMPVDRRTKRYQVQVLTPAGVPELREVTVGVTNRVTAEIKEGLQAGEKILLGGQQRPGAGNDANRPARLRGF